MDKVADLRAKMTLLGITWCELNDEGELIITDKSKESIEIFNGIKKVKGFSQDVETTLSNGIQINPVWSKARQLKLKYLTMNESVESISPSAFSRCIELRKVVLSNNLKNIGESAFSNCITLSLIDFKNNIEIIGRQAFYNCNNIYRIDLQTCNKLKEIQGFTFALNKNLSQVILSESIEVIGEYAFNDCELLEYINLDNVKHIEWTAFKGCNRLFKKEYFKEYIYKFNLIKN